MTIFLIGFMGCGKTTVGKLLAAKLGIRYVDSDECIVQSEGMTVPEIFEQKGEPYFREVEEQTVKGLCEKPEVIACGGGAMLRDSTAQYASANGTVIFLDVPFNICYERICGDPNRPIVTASSRDELLARYNARYPVYCRNSDVQIDCGAGSPLDCTEKILESIKYKEQAKV